MPETRSIVDLQEDAGATLRSASTRSVDSLDNSAALRAGRSDASPHQLLIFQLDDQRFGLPLEAIERVARVVEMISLPMAPDIVLGVIDVQGRIVPVVDVRRRFRLPSRDVRLSDHLIIARTTRRCVALLVDAAGDVVECPASAMIPSDAIVPDMGYVSGVARLPDGAILIHDLESFLSLDEHAALDAAVQLSKAAVDGD